uniref:Uncharacterized protein n=1 Tax=Chromera velia CCMP2878 TaxID=1169474 RepID=A0A0G4FMM7_9ALVE|eukprot:Cvel_17829.t1-p1 / transcript=Cvel_17829.t1 / gene=Cvel_17829 / organism=Chromera_velia_CCMP2878 / gene_product=hypothetical protein / transcript_product=hypothetical protein / location=Cvel_scaffold1445:19700-26957(+) / protein_length=142 / sequence_SO=supercontig / SO=protein_coding / is_pseudo=false
MGDQCQSISSTLSGFLHWIRCLERSLYPFSDVSAYDPGSSFPRGTVQPSPGMSSYSRNTTQVKGLYEPFDVCKDIPPIQIVSSAGRVDTGATTISSFVSESGRTGGQPLWIKGSRVATPCEEQSGATRTPWSRRAWEFRRGS